MHRLLFFVALTLVLGATQALAQCDGIGCVRPSNALERLAETAKRTLSVAQVIEPSNAMGFCATGACATEPTMTPLPKNCAGTGCATPGPKGSAATATTDDGATIDASTLVTDDFARMAARSTRLPAAVPWTDWTKRWGMGGLYKGSIMD